MRQLRVSEMFYSLQGEGVRAGTPTWFIRLAGCNKACAFCDTDHSEGKFVEPEILVEKILASSCRAVVWTGGEPLLELTAEHIALFKTAGIYQAVETNGSIRPPDGLDWVTVSPKVPNDELEETFSGLVVDELKYVIGENDLLPSPTVQARHYCLSPMFDGDVCNPRALRRCIALCLENPRWRLSVQQHKLWGIQ